MISHDNENDRRRQKRTRGAFFYALLLFTASGQDVTAEPEPQPWESSLGKIIIGSADLQDAQLEIGTDNTDADVSMTFVSLNDDQIETAIRLEILKQPSGLTAIEASFTTKADIPSDAQCLVHLMARAVEPQTETGLARISVAFREQQKPDIPIFSYELFVEPTWTAINIPFQIVDALDAGEAKASIGVGSQLQVIDVGNVTVRCVDPDQAVSTFPKTSYSYAGRAPDASWREMAEAQIDRYRKSDLVINVVDPRGQPVPDAEVHIQMTRHAFKFGAIIDAAILTGRGINGEPDGHNAELTARYRKTLQQLFNVVAFAEDTNWAAWQNTEQRAIAEEALTWLEALDLELRGTQLLPNDWSNMPADVLDKRGDPEALRQAIADHIQDIIQALDGQVAAWDVVNRSVEDHVLIERLGWQEIASWFETARSASGQPALYFTETDVLAGDRLGELMTTLNNLSQQDVPLDAIGIKGQFHEQPPPIQVISDRLDQLASFDLPMMITEFDINTKDETLCVDFTRDLMTLAFSHPSVDGFILSNFWSDSHTPAEAAMYQADWQISPVGEIYNQLVKVDWWTDDIALSNADGDLQARGFLGDYTITARKNDLSASTSFTLGEDGASIQLQLSKSTSG